jgi:hypothetical protein
MLAGREVQIDWNRVEVDERRHKRETFMDRLDDCFACEGQCLSPWLNSGDVVFFDREIEPADGDLVVVEARFRKQSSRLGEQPTIRREKILKQWRIIDGEPWLSCNDGWIEMPLDARRLGVVTVLHRADQSQPMIAMNFDQGAALRFPSILP